MYVYEVDCNRGVMIAGVDVGHQFFSRCEMVTVGFHNHWLNGIDYIGNSQKEVILFNQGTNLTLLLSFVVVSSVCNADFAVYN